MPVDRSHATEESIGPEEFAQAQVRVHDLREQILANPRVSMAYERLLEEIEEHTAAKGGPTWDGPTWDALGPGEEDIEFWNILSVWSQDWNSLEDSTNLP